VGDNACSWVRCVRCVRMREGWSGNGSINTFWVWDNIFLTCIDAIVMQVKKK